jgi:hypothetical protein
VIFYASTSISEEKVPLGIDIYQDAFSSLFKQLPNHFRRFLLEYELLVLIDDTLGTINRFTRFKSNAGGIGFNGKTGPKFGFQARPEGIFCV